VLYLSYYLFYFLFNKIGEKNRFLPGSEVGWERVEEEWWHRREVAQTKYTYMNKCIKKKTVWKKNKEFCEMMHIF
jgi:hypothetical protein